MASNTVEYILRLTDKFTGTLSTVASAASNFAARMERNRAQTDRMGNSINGLHEKIRQLEEKRNSSTAVSEIRRINVEIRNLQRQAGQLENMPPMGFINRIRYANDGFGSLIKTALKGYSIMQAFQGLKAFAGMGMDMEQTRAKFEVLLGSLEKGSRMIADINNMANATPFSNADLTSNAETLLAFNIAGEKVLPTMKMLGDVAMGDKTKLQGLTLAYAQMSSTGRLMGQDLLQMINQGFNPLVEMSKMTDKSLADLKKSMEKGAISAEMVEKAFIHATSEGGRFYQMMEKMSETAQGKFSPLLGKLQAKITDYAERLNPFIAQLATIGIAFVDNIDPVIQAVQGLFMSFAPIFDAVKLILQAFNLLGNSAFTVGGALGVLTNLFHLLSIPVKIVANGILGLTQFFINCKNTLITLTVIMAIYRLAMWQATLATQGWTIATKLQYTWLLLCEKAQKLFNATLLKNPFTAALVGITLVVGALMTLRKRTREASDEFAKAKEAAQSYYAQERQSLDQIFEKLKRTNPKSKERNELVDELKRMYPDLNAELEKEVRNTNELSGAYDALISKIALRARIEAKKTALVDIYKGMEGFDNAVSTFADDIIKEGGSYTIDKEGERSEVDVSEANRSLIENDIKNKLLRNDASLGAGMLRINVNGNNYDLDIKTALDYLKSDEKAKRLQKQIADITFGDGDGGTSGGMTFTSTNADTFNSISAGGSKPTNIYITLTKDVVGQITIHANSVAESTTEMVDVVKQGMLQVLNSANAIATS